MVQEATNGGSEKSQLAITVEQLIAVNPYNPDILPDLENYVNEQVLSQTYNLDANLCLLRLYQFEPDRMSTPIVARILVKALMAMPAPDYSLCLFLIPERVQIEEQFKTLNVLSHFLETARFRQFWDEAAKSRHIVEAVSGFEQAIRAYAVHVLSITYQKVPRTILAEAINIEGVSLDKFLEHQVSNNGWVVEKGQGKGQLITLPPTEFNHPCENLEHNKKLYERICEIAATKGCTPSQLALAWVHHQGNDVCPIPGTTKIENLNQNIGALSIKLTSEDMTELESIASANAVQGDRYGSAAATYKDSETPPLSAWKAT